MNEKKFQLVSLIFGEIIAENKQRINRKNNDVKTPLSENCLYRFSNFFYRDVQENNIM